MTPQSLPVATPLATVRFLRTAVRPRRTLVAAVTVTLLAATSTGLLVPPLLGRIVDVVLGASLDATAAARVGWLVAVLAVAVVVEALLVALSQRWVARLGEGLLADLRERFVDRVLRLPLATLEGAGSGDVTSRATHDVTTVAEAVRTAFPELLRSSLTIALTAVGIAVTDWRFLLAALVAVPVQVHATRWYGRQVGPLYARQRAAVADQQQSLLESVGGARTVRAFGLVDAHVGELGRRSTAAVDLTLTGIRLQTRFFGRLNVAEYVGLSALLAVGFLLVGRGAASVGEATAAALYFHGLFGPVNVALYLIDEAQAALAGLNRLVGVVDLPESGSPSTAVRPVDASVRVRGARYVYPQGLEVLRGVDLDVPAGHRVALVGSSGAGKTTLVALVAGVHTATAGSVRLGGADVAELTPDVLRTAVALLTQEAHVFAGSLADDLRLARPAATDSELRDALARVGALDWVHALPEGTATVVGAGGYRLTAVQVQLIGLARLVLADPALAVLDEATADAGSAAARLLERAADGALAGRTGIVVAHRLTQAARADEVVVLEGGEVVERGPHAELLAAGGRYAALWTAWRRARPDDVP